MRRLFSATFGAGMLLAGLAVVYKQLAGIDPFTVHIFALGGLLATAGVAWMILDIAGPEDRRR
jgi:hypothetical protein